MGQARIEAPVGPPQHEDLDEPADQDAEERAAMAREMIGVLSDGLREAMASTPQILYCVAAGNSDSDVEFDVSIPANFDLDNMIVVGAVDSANDRMSSFSSWGPVSDGRLRPDVVAAGLHFAAVVDVVA